MTESARKYDLTRAMVPYFDVHLVIPLLDFLSEIKLYDPKEITRAKIKVILSTNMMDLAEDEFTKFKGDAEFDGAYAAQRNSIESRKAKCFEALDNEPKEVAQVREFFENEARVAELKATSCLTIDILASSFGISTEALDAYYAYCKFKYECGLCQDAAAMLNNYLSVAQPQSNSVLGALWGRLSCRIFEANWEESLQDFLAIKEAIESRNIAPVDQLRQRAWLLHSSLFVFLNQREGYEAHANFFTEKVYMSTMENLCPWMLRYYALSVIIGSKRKSATKELLNEIQSLAHLYSDPITQFVEAIYDRFDFDEAQRLLKLSQEIIKNDFFMQIHADRFMQEARMLICEVYCSIYRRVDLNKLTEKLELTQEQAEKWMVDMVQKSTSSAVLDATIDSSSKQVIIAPPSGAGQQHVLERTRDLTVRSGMLTANIDSLLSEQAFYIKHRL